MTDVRVGEHTGYDRFVVEFSGSIPTYRVTRQDNPVFTGSPRGDRVTLAGTAGVLIVLHPVTNWTSYTSPSAFTPGFMYLRQARMIEDFEGYQQWALGIQGTPCLRVLTLASPTRLVIDIAAMPG